MPGVKQEELNGAAAGIRLQKAFLLYGDALWGLASVARLVPSSLSLSETGMIGSL